MTRLSLVYTASSLGWGARETRILSEAHGLIGRGHEVSLLCPPESRIGAEALTWGVPATALPIGKVRPKGISALLDWFGANRCDVVSTHSATDAWLIALTLLVLGRPYPMVRTLHLPAPVGAHALNRWLYTRATARIVTIDGQSKSHLVERNGFPAVRIDSVPSGTDPVSLQEMLDEMERIYREASGRA